MRPGMVAVIADAPARVERANEIAQALGQLGLALGAPRRQSRR